MPPQPFIFSGWETQQQQPDQSTAFNFSAIVPSIEDVDHDTGRDPHSRNAGRRTSSESDFESPDEWIHTPSHSSVAPFEPANSLGISERLRELSLSPGQSTSTNAGNTTSLRADTSERHTSLSDPLPSPSQLDLDGDRMNTGSENGSNTSSLDDVPQGPLPQAPVYDSDLQAVLRDVKEHLASICSDMERCSLIADQESDLSKQFEQVRMASQLDCPETRTVGFIGDSGVGKSRLINSLLDINGLARSSAEGSACTSVVTEFRDIDAHHPNWTIEVIYMDSEEVKELLQELLQSFRMYYTDVFREVTKIEEQERIREQSTRAWATFHSMFRNQPDLTHEFLADQTEGAYSRILGRLQQWAQHSCRQRPGGPVLHHSVVLGSFERCQSYLDTLTTDLHGEGQTAIWPFIKLIRVYLSSPILRTGLVLADLPGFRDLNFARVRATDRYLKHSCSEIFVVTTISRCITDQSINEIKSRCNKGQPMRIVCTRSEDVIADEMARKYRDLAPQIGRLEGQVRHAGSRLAEALGRSRDGSSDDLRELLNNNHRARFELDRFLIWNRNQRIEAPLRERDEGVRVFCVSNNLYSEHREGSFPYGEDYLNLSGIRQLRHYCQLVPAEAQFRFIATFLEHRAPAVFRSVKQWTLTGCDNVTAERAKSLRQVLLDVEKVFRETLILQDAGFRTLPRRLEDRFNEEILNVAYERVFEWSESALQTSRVWQGWYHNTYGAFCRKYGTYQTGSVGSHCWNTELLEGTRTAWEGPWLSLERWILSQTNQLNGAVRAAFQKNIECLNDNLRLAPIALENLIDNMSDREACIIDSVEQLLNRLIEELSLIKEDALYGHASSYMAGLMRPVYNKCNSDSGGGVDARRKGYMRDHLTNHTVFLKLIRAINTDCRSLFEKTQSELRQVINQEMANLCSDLHVTVAEGSEMTEATRFSGVASRLRDKVEAAETTIERAHEIVGSFHHFPITPNTNTPFGRSRTNPVAANDVAEVTVAVLLEPSKYTGRVIELTGPRSADMYDCAKEYSSALGRPISYAEIPLETWKDDVFKKNGLPEHVYQHIATMAKLHAVGDYDRVTDSVQEILGRPAASISATIKAHRHNFPVPSTTK